MTEIPRDDLDKIIQQASGALTDSQDLLRDLIKDQSPIHVTDAERLLLILSYRLDTQDALMKILQIEHGLLQILGLAPQHSTKVNLERMNFALGHDELQKMLRSLSLLLHSLLQVAQKNQKPPGKHRQNQPTASLSKWDLRFQKAIERQKQGIHLLETLGTQLDLWYQQEAMGPVLDHIASLHGPISRFYQAVQNGLGLSYQLYEKTNQTIHLDKTLISLLKQTNLILQPLPSMPQPHPFFTPTTVSEERLEQRASAKRLGNFFNH